MLMAQVNVMSVAFMNNPLFTNQFVQTPYTYTPLTIKGDILSQNLGYIHLHPNNNSIPYQCH